MFSACRSYKESIIESLVMNGNGANLLDELEDVCHCTLERIFIDSVCTDRKVADNCSKGLVRATYVAERSRTDRLASYCI